MRKKTIEDYAEIIYNLQKKKKRVQTSDIAQALNINPASVTEIFQKLSKEGYLHYEKYSGVSLTDKGRIIALKTRDKHAKIKEFLITLGVDKKTAESDACEIEHIIHKTTMDTIEKFLEIVKTCEITPLLINRLNNYKKTGKLEKCPDEIYEICKKYQTK